MSARRGRSGAARLDDLVEPFRLDIPHGELFWRGFGKRVFDVLASLALAPLALPIIVVASAAVLLSMGWPPFYRQARVGLGGQRFMILKVRTMRPLPAQGQVATAMTDPRVTPVGRWLRRFHVDELPQLWNVLAGEMSLIGPRPEQPELAEAYARETPAFTCRQLIRPGITGWAQVRTGYAADLPETRVKLGYDLFYLQNSSLALDLEICGRTILTLISGAGAR